MPKSMKKKSTKEKLEKLEEAIRYNEAMLEELYEKQEALFPVFADLIKIISKLYKEMKIEDEDVRSRINRLKDTFNNEEESEIIKKYSLRENDNDDFSVAYT